MVVAITTISVLLVLLFFLVGGIIGWIANNRVLSYQYESPIMHPEMFDENGNLLPDKIISVHFEGVELNDDDIEEEGDEACN
jgi:hypothetical protein